MPFGSGSQQFLPSCLPTNERKDGRSPLRQVSVSYLLIFLTPSPPSVTASRKNRSNKFPPTLVPPPTPSNPSYGDELRWMINEEPLVTIRAKKESRQGGRGGRRQERKRNTSGAFCRCSSNWIQMQYMYSVKRRKFLYFEFALLPSNHLSIRRDSIGGGLEPSLVETPSLIDLVTESAFARCNYDNVVGGGVTWRRRKKKLESCRIQHFGGLVTGRGKVFPPYGDIR